MLSGAGRWPPQRIDASAALTVRELQANTTWSIRREETKGDAIEVRKASNRPNSYGVKGNAPRNETISCGFRQTPSIDPFPPGVSGRRCAVAQCQVQQTGAMSGSA